MIDNLDDSDHNQQGSGEFSMKILQQAPEIKTGDIFCGVCLFKLMAGVQSLTDFRNTSPLLFTE